MADLNDHMRAGQEALSAADWLAARANFEAALVDSESPEAHDGLGIALWWLNELASSHEHRTAAFIEFKQRQDYPQAVLIASWLAREQVFLYSNSSAMNGWFARAERLLTDLQPCPENGWYMIMRASMLESPVELAKTALNTIKIAKTFNTADLEVLALAFRGLALVTLCNIAEGMAHLDEAMTIALSGEIKNFMVISECFCLTLSACELAGDLVRCEHWCHAATQFAERYKCPFLSAYCRTTYGSLLVASGRWDDAEIALNDAVRLFQTGHRGLRVHAVLKLAELRVWQGKLEEAEVLLTGLEDYGSAAVPLARLYFARGERDQARAILEQALEVAQSETLGRVPLLTLFIEVTLAQGSLDIAQRAFEELKLIAENTQNDILIAQTKLAGGQIEQHSGKADAISSFQLALARLRTQEQSLLAGRVRFEMAQVLVDTDRVGAAAWAKAALATFERIGARHEADRATSLLRQLGSSVSGRTRSQQLLSEREAEVLGLIARGLTNRQIAARLVISPKTVEHHVSQILSKLGLRSRAEAAAFAAGSDHRATG